MSSVHVNIVGVRATHSGHIGQALPAIDSVEYDAETITASGTSAQSTIEVPEDYGKYVWTVQAGSSGVFVRFGANPTAVSGSGHYIPAYGYRVFGCRAQSEKVAVKEG